MYIIFFKIHEILSTYRNLLLPIAKWIFITTSAYILTKKHEKILKPTIFNELLKVLRFLSRLFIYYYIAMFVFLPQMNELNIYAGIQDSILFYTKYLERIGWLMLILLVIDIIWKLLRYIMSDKTVNNKILPKNKYFVFTFIIASIYTSLSYIFGLIFLLIFK